MRPRKRGPTAAEPPLAASRIQRRAGGANREGSTVATISATWNATSGLWFSAGNWDAFNELGQLVHYVPNADNDVQLPDNSGTTPGTPFVVTYNGTSTINTLNGSVIGLVDMTGGKLTVLNGGFRVGINVDAGAELALSAGTLSIEKGDFAGKVSGAGALRMVDGAYTIEAGASFTVATWIITHQIGSGVVPTVTLETDFSYARTFRLEDTFGNLPIFDLNGRTLMLSGTATLTGVVDGPGVMKLTGQDSAFAGIVNAGATLEVASELAQIGRAFNDGLIKVDAGATYEISTASNIDSSTIGGGRILNAGDFLVTGAGVSSVNAAFTNTGTLEVGDGARLNLIGSASLRGSVTGDGTLAFGFAHNVTINATSFDVAAVYINGGNGGGVARLGKSLAYDGDLTFENQFGTFDLNGKTLTLSGDAAFSGGSIDGPGRLVFTGSSALTDIGVGSGAQGQAVTIENAGRLEQFGFLQLKGAILNDEGAVWRIARAGDITDNGGSFRNDGVLVVEGDGRSAISVDFVNANTVTINAGSELAFAVGETVLRGQIKGAGTLTFGFAHDVTIDATKLLVEAIYINGGNGGGTATVARALTYKGDFTLETQFGALELDRTLTLTGDVELRSGAVRGDARLVISGDAVFGFVSLDAAVTITGAGSVRQTGNIDVLAVLTIGSNAAYDMAGAEIYDNLVEGRIVVDGLLERSVDGVGRVATRVATTEDGAIVVENGALVFTRGVNNLGVIEGVISRTGDVVTVTADTGAKRHLTGGAGDNAIDLGKAAGIVDAGAGNDSITGGLGADVLKGGGGADVFVLDAKLGPNNVDRITDFSSRDELHLDHDVFKALRVGDLAGGAFKDLSAARIDANDRILYDHDTGRLFYDADGRGGKAAVLFATLTTEPDLSAADFLIV